ncbi:hypothetical protein D3C73_778540 [compost metagenome]
MTTRLCRSDYVVHGQGSRTQQSLVTLQASTQVGAHVLARGIGITFNDGIDNSRMLFLQMKIIILWTGSRRSPLKLSARNNP